MKKPPCYLNIERGREWETFKACVCQGKLKPWHKIDVKFQDAAQKSEGAIDAGGPTKELLQTLMEHIQENLNFWIGAKGNKFPIMDVEGKHKCSNKEIYTTGGF